MRDSKEPIKIRLSTVIFLFLIVILISIIIGMYVYYNNFNNVNLENNNKNLVNANNETESGYIENNNVISKHDEKKKININDELITEIYQYIPCSTSIVMLLDEKDAYQSEKVTIEDISEEFLAAHAFELIDFSEVECYPYPGQNQIDEWFSFDADILYDKEEKIYGERLENVLYFKINWARSCEYENGMYNHSWGGGGDRGVRDVRSILEAYQEKDEIIIIDKYLQLYSQYCDKGEIYKVYNSSDRNELIAEEKIEKYRNGYEEEISLRYSSNMQKYKHTFIKNENGLYYWYSTEPI